MSNFAEALPYPMRNIIITHNGQQYTISTRQTIPEGTDLSGFNFSTINKTPQNSINGKLNLSGAKLKGVNLSRCNLENVYLYFANLEDADLERANLANSDLRMANLKGTNLSYLQSLDNTKLDNSIMNSETNFTGVNFSNVIFNDWITPIFYNGLDLTHSQIEQLNTSNLMYEDIADYYFARDHAREDQRRLQEIRGQTQRSTNTNIDAAVFNEVRRVDYAQQQAEQDVRRGLNEEQRGMQQAEIARKQKEIQTNLARATAQALLANKKDESVFGECAICYDAIKFGEEAVDAHNDIYGKKSGHVFHKDCIMHICNDHFAKKECPECRAPLLCKEIENGSRDINTNLGLKGGKKNKRKSKRRVTNKRGKRRVTNKRGKRRY